MASISNGKIDLTALPNDLVENIINGMYKFLLTKGYKETDIVDEGTKIICHYELKFDTSVFILTLYTKDHKKHSISFMHDIFP